MLRLAVTPLVAAGGAVRALCAVMSEGEAGRGKKRKLCGEAAGGRYVPPPTKRRAGLTFGDEEFGEAESYLEGGLRKVRPYYFAFHTYCKGRWVGRSLGDVFRNEFRAQPPDYYRRAAAAGRLLLNGEPLRELSVKLKDNDFLRNTMHRHEPPVTAQPLRILAETEDLVVVDKPSSLPVHPCGRFRHNTVIFILGKEHNIKELYTIHRLDRLTSGVLMFARSSEVSRKMAELVRERKVEKEYVCRVSGEFPEETLTCEEPILVVSNKIGVCRVHPKGKPSKTVFQRLNYNGKSSVVKCFPYTGRTHQIRVHLQYLGHPIVNDPIYNTDAWGPNRGKDGDIGKTNEELLQMLIDEHKSKQSLDLLGVTDDLLALSSGQSEDANPCLRPAPNIMPVDKDPACGEVDPACGEVDPACGEVDPACGEVDPACGEVDPACGEVDPACGEVDPACGEVDPSVKDCDVHKNNPEEELIKDTPSEGKVRALEDPLCEECKIRRADPSPTDLIMYLHALRYKGEGFDFSTQLPEWAEASWIDD